MPTRDRDQLEPDNDAPRTPGLTVLLFSHIRSHGSQSPKVGRDGTQSGPQPMAYRENEAQRPQAFKWIMRGDVNICWRVQVHVRKGRPRNQPLDQVHCRGNTRAHWGLIGLGCQLLIICWFRKARPHIHLAKSGSQNSETFACILGSSKPCGLIFKTK